jgi:hypothetical protein
MRVGEEGLGAERGFRVRFILWEQNKFRICGGVNGQCARARYYTVQYSESRRKLWNVLFSVLMEESGPEGRTAQRSTEICWHVDGWEGAGTVGTVLLVRVVRAELRWGFHRYQTLVQIRVTHSTAPYRPVSHFPSRAGKDHVLAIP